MKERFKRWMAEYFSTSPRIFFIPSPELIQLIRNEERLKSVITHPGVINGTVSRDVLDGTILFNYDKLVEGDYPTQTFIPEESKLAQE